MSNDAHRYCNALGELAPEKAINAIHEAFTQLGAAESGLVDCLDHKPALETLAECLRDAGHIGFRKEGGKA